MSKVTILAVFFIYISFCLFSGSAFSAENGPIESWPTHHGWSVKLEKSLNGNGIYCTMEKVEKHATGVAAPGEIIPNLIYKPKRDQYEYQRLGLWDYANRFFLLVYPAITNMTDVGIAIDRRQVIKLDPLHGTSLIVRPPYISSSLSPIPEKLRSKLINAMRKGKRIMLTNPSGSDFVLSTLSLRGTSAAINDFEQCSKIAHDRNMKMH